MSDDDSNVIDFDARRFGDQSGNHKCPNCGGEWFHSPGIVLDNAFRVTGYGLPLKCIECEPQGIHLVQTVETPETLADAVIKSLKDRKRRGGGPLGLA